MYGLECAQAEMQGAHTWTPAEEKVGHVLFNGARESKGEWEGHHEREEQTREEGGEARGSHTTGAFLLPVCHRSGILSEPSLSTPGGRASRIHDYESLHHRHYLHS